MAETLDKFFKRRYWVFCAELSIMEFGVDNLVWSKNTFEKAEALVAKSPYSHNYLLDRETGQVTAYINGSVETYTLSRAIQKKQREYRKLVEIKQQKQSSVSCSKDSFSF